MEKLRNDIPATHDSEVRVLLAFHTVDTTDVTPEKPPAFVLMAVTVLVGHTEGTEFLAAIDDENPLHSDAS